MIFIGWLAVTVAFVVLEVHTGAFYALFVAAGSAVATVTALLGGGPWLQGSLFAAVAVIGLTMVRPLTVRRFERAVPIVKQHGIQASADGLVGQRAITVDTVGDESHPGHTLFAGDKWLAVTDIGEPLPPDIPVVVVAVRGTTLLVHPEHVINTPAPPPPGSGTTGRVDG